MYILPNYYGAFTLMYTGLSVQATELKLMRNSFSFVVWMLHFMKKLNDLKDETESLIL